MLALGSWSTVVVLLRFAAFCRANTQLNIQAGCMVVQDVNGNHHALCRDSTVDVSEAEPGTGEEPVKRSVNQKRSNGFGSLVIPGNSATFYTGIYKDANSHFYPKYTTAKWKTTKTWPPGIQQVNIIENCLYDGTHRQGGGKSTPIQGINGCISGFPYGQKILNPWWVAYQNNGKWEGNPQKILGALPSDGSFPAVAQSNSANNLIASGTDAQEPGSSTQGNPVNQATQEIPENQDLNLENPTEPSQETEPSQQAEPSQQTKRRRRAVHS